MTGTILRNRGAGSFPRFAAAQLLGARFWGLVATLAVVAAAVLAAAWRAPVVADRGVWRPATVLVVAAACVSLLMYFPIGYGQRSRSFPMLLGGYLGGFGVKLAGLGAILAGAWGIPVGAEYAVGCAYVAACFLGLLASISWAGTGR